jgi:hypothetical protein
MKKILMLALVALPALAVGRGAVADTIPFPAVHAGSVFVIAHTVTTDGVMSDYFAPDNTVVFRSYAVDAKTRKVLMRRDVTYFYVSIPNQPNVKLRYTPNSKYASGQYQWTGQWTVPSDYPVGTVKFKVWVKTVTRHIGYFQQMPVVTSQLTISTTPQIPSGPGPSGGAAPSGKVTTVIYADSVNGTRPSGAAPRPIGCTQTNVFKRGEQFVQRAWGFDLTSGEVLSIDNVTEAHFTVPGVPDIPLNWGAHGPQKVFFWTNFWNIPADYPLGTTVVKITYTLTSGKVATLDYPIVITP